jgi:hypothetical protein
VTEYGVRCLCAIAPEAVGRRTSRPSRLIVYLGLDEESALLGMFDKEPKTLARILLWELIKRQTAKTTA